VLRDHAVGQFVKQETSEEEKACENTYAPLLSRGPAGLLRELLFEKVGVRGKNDDPRGMQIDRYTKDFADPHSWGWRHVDWYLEARCFAAQINEAGSRAYSFRALLRRAAGSSCLTLLQ
jgi:hypothetical protein